MIMIEQSRAETENRYLKRFRIALPAILEQSNGNGSNGSDRLSLISRDISARGAFFLSPQTLPVGTSVKVKLFLLQGAGSDRANQKAEVDLCGSVVRVEPDGLAVCFEKKYEIFPFGKSAS